ncbi:MAG: outer membrane protein G, partial [Patiriisocius sp.]
MKTFFTLVTLLSTTLFFAQAYSGKGDVKFGVGVNIQSDGTGISGTLDYGLGENISIGIQSIYLLGVEDYESE